MHALPTPDQIVKTGIVTALTIVAVLTGLKKGGPHKTIGAMMIIIGAIGFGTFLGEQVQSWKLYTIPAILDVSGFVVVLIGRKPAP